MILIFADVGFNSQSKQINDFSIIIYDSYFKHHQFLTKVSVKEWSQVLKQYRPKKILFYNSCADIAILKYNGYKIPFNLSVVDYYNIVLQSVCSSQNYCKFCVVNNYYTKKGNIRTNLSVVYRYLYQSGKRYTPHKTEDDVRMLFCVWYILQYRKQRQTQTQSNNKILSNIRLKLQSVR